jgi:hypothetical protein
VSGQKRAGRPPTPNELLLLTRPAAAARPWSRLNRKLIDLAIIVPTVTPKAVDVVSRHIPADHHELARWWGSYA